jgi:cytoskeleton protein RodZ
MSSTLGEKLRHAREERGISVSEVAEQTRISPLYIAAIERDDYKTLPGGIFNKGFVRSYAKYVGFDEQQALQEYAQIAAGESAAEEARHSSYRPEVLTDDQAPTSLVPTVIIAVVMLALMSGGIIFLVRYLQEPQSEPRVGTIAPVVNTNKAAVPAPDATPAPAADVPAMGNVKFEFAARDGAAAEGDRGEISLSSSVDGERPKHTLVKPGDSLIFEPRESLKLSYHRSRARFAELKINGKVVALPSEPLNPRSSSIEVDINAQNLAKVWQGGEYTAEAAATTETTATPAPQTAANRALPAPRPSPRVAETPAGAVPPATNRPAAEPAPAGTPDAQ